MKHIHINKEKIIDLWLEQKQDYASNPEKNFYFKKNTIYSYRDSFPIAKIVKKVILITTKTCSQTTSKHISKVSNAINQNLNFDLHLSDDMIKPNFYDKTILEYLKLLHKSKSKYNYNTVSLLNKTVEKATKEKLITKKKFPMFFDEKYNKIKIMILSQDVETTKLGINLAIELKLLKLNKN